VLASAWHDADESWRAAEGEASSSGTGLTGFTHRGRGSIGRAVAKSYPCPHGLLSHTQHHTSRQSAHAYTHASRAAWRRQQRDSCALCDTRPLASPRSSIRFSPHACIRRSHRHFHSTQHASLYLYAKRRGRPSVLACAGLIRRSNLASRCPAAAALLLHQLASPPPAAPTLA